MVVSNELILAGLLLHATYCWINADFTRWIIRLYTLSCSIVSVFLFENLGKIIYICIVVDNVLKIANLSV